MNHVMGFYHVECPERLEAIYAMLNGPDMAGRFLEIPVEAASRDTLSLVHSPEYIDRLAETEGREYSYLDPDTQTSSGSYEAALLAAGGLCNAVSMVVSGALNNAFALVRPPGHHAERSRAMGFCLFNNVAIGAMYARTRLALRRILIVDWDLHHGNGTQHTFEADASVLYFSTHQYPFYPGTGAYLETGIGEGEGFTVNVPLPAGCGDMEYVGIFQKVLRPVALEFEPELILVSAGFDCYRGDPLGAMNVTTGGFATMTRILMDIAESCCGGRLVITLEGGYNIRGQRDSVKKVLNTLSEMEQAGPESLPAGKGNRVVKTVIERVREVHRHYWKCF